MPTPSSEVRAHLVAALHADLVGPFSPTGVELLRLPPSRWYLTGFLAPDLARHVEHDPDDEDELGAGDDTDEPDTQGSAEPEPKQKRFLPASMGLTLLLRKNTASVPVRVRWADYVGLKRKELEALGEAPSPQPHETSHTLFWKRMPRPFAELAIPLTPGKETVVRVPDSGGVEIVALAETTERVPGIDDGTLSVSIFVVNRRKTPELHATLRDQDYLFQVELHVPAGAALVPRPDRHLEGSREQDDAVLDLQYRHHREYAVGHGCSATVTRDVSDGPVTGVCTTWIPVATVDRVGTRSVDGVVVEMEALAELKSGSDVAAALSALPAAYRGWVEQEAAKDVDSDERREARDGLVSRARRALRRIERGIEVLQTNPDALAAFRFANRAIAMSQRQRRPDDAPTWRLFQLAFVLLNLPGIVDPHDQDRDTVELIFFPTGGGKTEAYLGVIAFTLVLRRMRGQTRPDRGLGVAVILRYTLRLLTLDQLGRAAGVMCALELLRKEPDSPLGDQRFAIGLWVGRSASANRLKEVAKLVTDYRNGTGPSPFPLTSCPWCGHDLAKDSLKLVPDRSSPSEVVVSCSNFRDPCPFSARKSKSGLPVLFVDEQIYRELPCFIVATVDKFAMLPWRGETGMLFGRVHSRQGRQFFGPLDRPRSGAGSERLPGGLKPPELVVQDELHLIAGPLGTMVGLYETMIEELCVDRSGEKPVRPKILCATATVRRARKQIRALFGRDDAEIFPPAGVDAWDTFFAEVDRDAEKRMYIGIAANGRPMKRILLTTYLTLLAAAERRYDRKAEADQPADPYMTLVGYFNSLRELGGMRRLVEDEIHMRAGKIADRRPLDFVGDHPWLRNRDVSMEPVELTSRESTGKIAHSKERLRHPFAEKDHVDVCLASNMISVGVDIDRLGLMVVAGQPKTTSEYIQASSRVGRQEKWPGLVVTCFNVHKPRDRSHYEHFCAYHESFYRWVESQSVTPFSGPALDRGLAGAVVGMTRLSDVAMTPPKAVADIGKHKALAKQNVEALVTRAKAHASDMDLDVERLGHEVRKRGMALLDSWDEIIHAMGSGAGQRCYSRFDEVKEGKSLLRLFEDDANPPQNEHEARFRAPTSMRDVEASVHVWVDRGPSRRGT
jgi:hypothetical protein